MTAVSEISGPAGALEVLFRTSDAARSPHLPPAALVCHPHPLHGGTMHNKVVYALARALLTAGIDVLRFNFRGVGRSAGTFDDGRGERDDIRACLDWLGERYPGEALLMAGFSFGAWNGLTVAARDPRVTRLILAGLPVATYTRLPFDPGNRPTLLVHGALDGFGTPEQLTAATANWPGPTRTVVFEGVDHFFGGLGSSRSAGRLPEVEGVVGAWLAGPGTTGTTTV